MGTLTVFAERCVHQVVTGASCDACVQVCPQSAWKINADGLLFDAASCDSCGLCVAHCPAEALALPQAMPLLRKSGAGTEVLIACERAASSAIVSAPAQPDCQSGSAGQIPERQTVGTARLGGMDDSRPRPQVGITPCLQALTPHWVLHWTGTQAGSRVRYASADCQQCARGRGPSWQARFGEVVELLQAAGRPVPQLQQIPFSTWQQAVSEQHAPDGGRRGLLRALLRPPTQAAITAKPVPMTSARTPLLQLLREQGAGRALWAVALDTARCTWCMACVQLCRAGALQFAADTPPAAPGPDQARSTSPVLRTAAGRFLLDMQSCTGCGVCLDACDRQALGKVAVPGHAQQAVTSIALLLAHCKQCGVCFHHLARRPVAASHCEGSAATQDQALLCPACRQGRARQFDRHVQAGEVA